MHKAKGWCDVVVELYTGLYPQSSDTNYIIRLGGDVSPIFSEGMLYLHNLLQTNKLPSRTMMYVQVYVGPCNVYVLC